MAQFSYVNAFPVTWPKFPSRALNEVLYCGQHAEDRNASQLLLKTAASRDFWEEISFKNGRRPFLKEVLSPRAPAAGGDSAHLNE